MLNNQNIEETQVLPPEVDATTDTVIEQEPNLAPTQSEEELPANTEEIAKDISEESEPKQGEPKTPEEELKAKREAGKISQLERERNEYSYKASIFDKGIESASKIQNKETAIDELSRLASNQKEYEKLQSTIARVLPQFQNLSFEEFSKEVNQALVEQAKIDPANYENINKLEMQKLRSNFEEEKNLEIAKVRQQAFISTLVPSYGVSLRENPQQAQLDYDFALNKAVTTANYLERQGKVNGQDFNFDQLVANELSTLNPIYSTGGQAKKQLVNGLTQMVKGSSTTQPNSGSLDNLKLSPTSQAIYEERLNTWISRGVSKEEAHKKALAVVQ